MRFYFGSCSLFPVKLYIHVIGDDNCRLGAIHIEVVQNAIPHPLVTGHFSGLALDVNFVHGLHCDVMVLYDFVRDRTCLIHLLASFCH